MTQSNSDKLTALVQDLQEFAFSQAGSMSLLRLVGYGLLTLAFFDIVEMLYPPNFTNSAWVFRTFGSLVERVPVPLLGAVLVFYGEFHRRTKWEILIVKVLSWLMLLLALTFFLLIPLGVGNTIRLNNQNITRVNAVSQQQTLQAEQVENRVKVATKQDLENFLRSQGRIVEIKDVEQVRGQILSDITRAKTQIKEKAAADKSAQQRNLIKSSVKWNLGALLAGYVYFMIWKLTDWARASR